MIKYFLHLDSSAQSVVVGLKYSFESRKFTIGGYTKYEEHMLGLIDTFFSIDESEYENRLQRKLIQKNKVQLIISHVKPREALMVFSEMRKSNLSLQHTSNFLKIMR